MNLSYLGDIGARALADIKGIRIDFNSNLVQVALLTILIVILVFFIDLLLSRSFLGRNYRLFVAPGVIVHEFSHALFCMLTGAKVTSISLFDKTGGSVMHEKPKLPVLGQVLISLAPFAIGLILVYFLASWAGLSNVDFKSVSLSYENIIPWLAGYISHLNIHDYKNWILIYLVLSVSVTMTPSLQDLKNIIMTLILLFLLILGIVKYSTFHLSLNFLPFDKILTLLSTVSVLLILCFLLSIVLFAISFMVRKKS